MSGFSGKRAYITGGSSGIGLAIGVRMAQLGADVALFGRSREKLESAKAKIERSFLHPDQHVYAGSMDVCDEVSVQGTVSVAVEAFGPPDVVILSAGESITKPFTDMQPGEFASVMQTNVMGTTTALSALLPSMPPGGGSVMLVASLAGTTGVYGYSAYCASKFALVGLAEVLRWELGVRGVGVSVLCPPEVDTPMIEEEKATIPLQTRAAKDMLGTLTPEHVAEKAVRGLERNTFMIIPGFRAKLLHLVGRVTPRWLMQKSTVLLTSLIVKTKYRYGA